MPSNFAQALFQGMDDSNQRRLQEQSMQRQNRLADLAVSREERADQTDQRGQLAQLARGWKSLTDSTQRKGYYDRFIQPAVSQMGFGDLGPYDEAAVDGVASQILAAYGNSGNQGKLFAQKIGQDGFIYTAYADGRMQNTGVKADRQAWFRDVEGQAPTIIGKSGEVIPVGGSAPPPQAPTPTPDGVYIDPSLPPAVQERIRQSVSMGQEPPAQMYFGQPAGGGGIAPKPTEAQTAYSKKVAELEAQLAQAKRMAEAEANAAQLKKEAELRAERGAQGAGKAPQLLNVERGLNRIDNALKALDGRYVNTGPLDQYVVGFSKEAQELRAAVGAIQNDMLALTRVPGVGSQSDLEARIANLKYPDLSYAPEVNRANAAQLRAFIRDLAASLGRGGGESPGAGDTASPDDPLGIL